MNEKEFIDALSAKTGIDDKRISKLMSSVADIVSSNLQEGKDVTIQGFGVFETKKKMEKLKSMHLQANGYCSRQNFLWVSDLHHC